MERVAARGGEHTIVRGVETDGAETVDADGDLGSFRHDDSGSVRA